MPHFIIEYAAPSVPAPENLVKAVFQAACDSQLFTQKDIKVRSYPCNHFMSGHGEDDFIHVTGYLIAGRSAQQKKHLNQLILNTLILACPECANVSVDARDLDPNTYSKKVISE